MAPITELYVRVHISGGIVHPSWWVHSPFFRTKRPCLQFHASSEGIMSRKRRNTSKIRTRDSWILYHVSSELLLPCHSQSNSSDHVMYSWSELVWNQPIDNLSKSDDLDQLSSTDPKHVILELDWRIDVLKYINHKEIREI